MKKILLSLGIVGLLTCSANAQNLESMQITLGVGTSIPARNDAFQAAAETGFYRVAQVEYATSDHTSLFATYDRSTMDATNGGEFDAVSVGGGLMVYIDLIPNNNWQLFLKMGGSKTSANEMFVAPDWEALGGVGVEGDFKGDAKFRLGVDFKDMATNEVSVDKSLDAPSGQLGGFFVYTAVTFAPVKLWAK